MGAVALVQGRKRVVYALVALVALVLAGSVAYVAIDRRLRARLDDARAALDHECTPPPEGERRAAFAHFLDTARTAAPRGDERAPSGTHERLESALAAARDVPWHPCLRADAPHLSIVRAQVYGQVLLADAGGALSGGDPDRARATRSVVDTLELGVALARTGEVGGLVVASSLLGRALAFIEASHGLLDDLRLEPAASAVVLDAPYAARGRTVKEVLLAQAAEYQSTLPWSFRIPLLRRRAMLARLDAVDGLIEEMNRAIAAGDVPRCDGANERLKTLSLSAASLSECDRVAKLGPLLARVERLRAR